MPITRCLYSYLLRMMRCQTPSTAHRWMNALLLLDDGWAAERVAEALFIDAETVARTSPPV
jgi:hypothetical protein